MEILDQPGTPELRKADNGNRIVAYLIDCLVMIPVFLIPILGLFVGVAYYITRDSLPFLDGQSIGKKIVGIVVIKLNGNALETNDYLVRWAYRAVDFGMSFFSVGTISILMSEKNQRLGDMIANTTVVKLKPDRIVTLSDLQNLPDKEDYVPKFPQVVRYSDEEMLALKNLLVRTQQYQNQTYKDILHETVIKLKEQMSLEEVKMDDMSFLREIISEYVILTR